MTTLTGLPADLLAPYIQAGAIEQVDVDLFHEGGKTTNNLTYGLSIIGAIVPIVLNNKYRPNTSFPVRLLQGAGASILGGGIGAGIGAYRMKLKLDAIGRTPAQTIQRLTLYQALSRHTTDPLNFALPPIPNPNDPASYGVEEFMARRAGAGGAPGPGAVVQASKENPWAGKQMPMPARPDQGGGGDDPARDSQGRLFGAPMMRREDMDENGEERGDAEAAERRRESERERGMQGGGALEQATLENPTSWSLLRARTPPPSTTTAPSASTPSISSSLPPPSIASSSSQTYGSSRWNPDNQGSSASGRREMTDREKEQADFDRLLDSERGAGLSGRGMGGGETRWSDLRDGGGAGGAGGGKKEEIW